MKNIPTSIALLASLAISVLFAMPACAQTSAPAATPPTSWIDPDTGHRVLRLTSDEPGSDDFYFNYNPFTPDGKKMAYMTPDSHQPCWTSRPCRRKMLVKGATKTIIVGQQDAHPLLHPADQADPYFFRPCGA